MSDDCICPSWSVPEGIRAFTTLRTGGCSTGPFASMNPAAHVGDDPASVSRNRERLSKRLALPSQPLWLRQVHGNRIIDAAQPDTREADASFTVHKNIVCAVLTADCLPVLLYHPDSAAIAAVHAGWRGLIRGVLETALKTIGEGAVAWLGPAIGAEVFEVGNDVRDQFLCKSKQFARAFKPVGKGKWLLDLYSVARIILSAGGVQMISGGEWCTYSDPGRFFSYRRDGVCGRMATLIWRV